jgi:hypothetical protein
MPGTMDNQGRLKITASTEDHTHSAAGDGGDLLDLDGTGELVLDADGDSKIYSSVDDEVIHTAGGAEAFTTKGVGIGMPAGKDIYPGGSANGLQLRFENLFGDDKPADNYEFTQRTFQTNDFVNRKAGFEDSQGSPYNFGASPGGFSATVPANTQVMSNNFAHFLTLYDQAGTGASLNWSEATARNNLILVGAAGPLWTASDYNMTEIRCWAVQAPGAADRYWACRINWMGATYPQFPLRVGLWYGTGLTYAWNDGTLVQLQVPLATDGEVHKFLLQIVGPNNCYLTPYYGDGLGGTGVSAAIAGWPGNFKTMIVRMGINWTKYHIDEVIIS